ncbi:MAG: hypothetical protein ABL882_09970 [Sphingopyxis sp.]
MLHENVMLGAVNSAWPAPQDAIQAIFGSVGIATAFGVENDSTGPGRGTFFDEFIDLRDPEGTAFTACILEILEAVRPRQRKRIAEALANHTTRTRKLLANAMRGHFYGTSPATLYYRKADAEAYQNKPRWMRHGTLAETVDAFEDAELVQPITGKWMPHCSKHMSWASSYSPTKKLLHIAAEYGVMADSIERRIPSMDLVQLFEAKPKPIFDVFIGELVHARKGKPVKFDPTTETESWATTLEAINAFYRKQAIALGPSQEGFHADIYRVFNNGDPANPKFDHGGRLFGGSWMMLPGDLRKAITINGQATVELDYSGCHPRMLYHERGLEPEGDIYTLPEIEALEAASGLERQTYRPLVKWLMQVLINGRGRPEAVERPDSAIIPRGCTIADIVHFIEAKHHSIADAFKTGAGLRLMRLESDVALEIIATAMNEDWTVLSVHDSFITTLDRREQLRSMMIDGYVRRLGKEPVIK